MANSAPNFWHQCPGAFVGDHHAALSQDQLDVTQAETENVIQPHGVVDEPSREAMAGDMNWVWASFR